MVPLLCSSLFGSWRDPERSADEQDEKPAEAEQGRDILLGHRCCVGDYHCGSPHREGNVMYECICGAVFEEPLIITEREHHGDGRFEYRKMVLCPVCQGSHYEEVDE